MNEESITMDIFKNHDKSFQIKGNWRKMIEYLEEITGKICKFEDWKGDVLSLDSKTDFFEIINEGSHWFIILRFNLRKSCYATMAMREFFHKDVSFKTQNLIRDKFLKE